jgi:hypothetical protein
MAYHCVVMRGASGSSAAVPSFLPALISNRTYKTDTPENNQSIHLGTILTFYRDLSHRSVAQNEEMCFGE